MNIIKASGALSPGCHSRWQHQRVKFAGFEFRQGPFHHRTQWPIQPGRKRRREALFGPIQERGREPARQKFPRENLALLFRAIESGRGRQTEACRGKGVIEQRFAQFQPERHACAIGLHHQIVREISGKIHPAPPVERIRHRADMIRRRAKAIGHRTRRGGNRQEFCHLIGQSGAKDRPGAQTVARPGNAQFVPPGFAGETSESAE